MEVTWDLDSKAFLALRLETICSMTTSTPIGKKKTSKNKNKNNTNPRTISSRPLAGPPSCQGVTQSYTERRGMNTFIDRLIIFLREIVLFGMDAFMVAASREVARRFWERLSSRGGAIAAISEGAIGGKTSVVYSESQPNRQRELPFLDEYRD